MTEAPNNPEKNPTRRRVIKAGGAIALGAAGLFGLGWEAMRRQDLRETIIDFSSNKADYRFLGGAHGAVNPVGNLNMITILRRELVPEDTTVFEVETGSLDYLSPENFAQLNRLYGILSSIDFFQEVTPVMTEKQLPLVLTDVSPIKQDPELLVNLAGGSPLAAIGLGASKDQNLRRRKLLQWGTLLGLEESA